jgi:carbon monoxide dehydrogenase subunit G
MSKGIGSSSRALGQLNFQPSPEGTQVEWRLEVKELGGLLKAVPQGLLKASAQKVVADLWTQVEANLQEPPV